METGAAKTYPSRTHPAPYTTPPAMFQGRKVRRYGIWAMPGLAQRNDAVYGARFIRRINEMVKRAKA